MALIVMPSNFTAQCCVGKELVRIHHQNSDNNSRQECLEGTQVVKDARFNGASLKLHCKKTASEFSDTDDGVNAGFLTYPEYGANRGSSFTLQELGMNGQGIIQPKAKKHDSGRENRMVSDAMTIGNDSAVSRRENTSPLRSKAAVVYNNCKSARRPVCSSHLGLNVSVNSDTGGVSPCSFESQGDENRLSRVVIMHSRANKVVSALRVYRKMEKSGLRPDLHACNSLISALLRNGSVDNALSILGSMKRMMIKPSEHTYSLLMKAVAHSKSCEHALHLLQEMETRDNLRPDIIVYNTLISACGKAHKWREVHQLWIKLKEKGCKETMVTYRLLVSTFVQCDQLELALEAYHTMVQNGWQVNGDILKGLTCVCAKEGQWALALQFFNKIVALGLKPNKITYNTLIGSLAKAGEVDHAFKIYKNMQAVGHSADVYTAQALLNGLNKTSQYARSLMLFEQMKKSSDFEMDTGIYNVALLSCMRLGLWENALQYIWGMEKSGIKPETSSYNLLLSTCEIAGQPKVALQVYEHMLSVNCTPNTFTILPLIRACGKGLYRHEVEWVLNGLSQTGIETSASMYSTLIKTLCSCGQSNMAKQFSLTMHSNRHNLESRSSQLTHTSQMSNTKSKENCDSVN